MKNYEDRPEFYRCDLNELVAKREKHPEDKMQFVIALYYVDNEHSPYVLGPFDSFGEAYYSMVASCSNGMIICGSLDNVVTHCVVEEMEENFDNLGEITYRITSLTKRTKKATGDFIFSRTAHATIRRINFMHEYDYSDS